MVDHRYWLHKARQALAAKDAERAEAGLPPRRPIVPWQSRERSEGAGMAERRRVQAAIDAQRKDRNE